MQLKRPSGSLRLSLMAATCSLLSPATRAQSLSDATADPQAWQLDSGLLYYKEQQGRVQSVEPVVSLRKDFGDDHVLTLKGTLDTLTGGSPNGALPSRTIQTFTSPSARIGSSGGSHDYTVAPVDYPLDRAFHDTRIALDASWSQPLGEDYHGSAGGHLSKEYDFLSAGGSFSVSRDFNSKNTTLEVSANGESDSVRPVGGAPSAGTDVTLLEKAGNKSKQVLGGTFGVTQVMSRTWLAQLNYSYDRSSGYLTDPYKVVSELDAGGSVSGYRFESRPDSRVRQSLYWGNKLAVGQTVLDASFRYGKDSWGSNSTTVDGRWRFNVTDSDAPIYLEPHVRWYRQDAATFYHLYLGESAQLPQYYSADQRLAEFTGTTFGLKLGVPIRGKGELSFRLESYRQKPSVNSSALPGLTGLDLNPGLNAVLFQVGWRQTF